MRAYCEHCRSEQRYDIQRNKHYFIIKEKTIELVRKVAICENCEQMIDVPELEEEVMHDIQQIYKRKWCQ